MASIVSIVSCSSTSKEGASNNPVAVQMLKMLPSNFGGFGYYDIYKIRTDENLVPLSEFLQSELSLPEQINGLGILGDLPGEDLYLWEGNFSLNQMLGNNSIGSYNYEGFTIWTEEYYDSVAMSDNISMSGRDSTIKRCIDVVNGKADSMYDDVKDVVNRLPASFMLGIQVLNSSYSSAYHVYGTAEAIQGDNDISTEIYVIVPRQLNSTLRLYITNPRPLM